MNICSCLQLTFYKLFIFSKIIYYFGKSKIFLGVDINLLRNLDHIVRIVKFMPSSYDVFKSNTYYQNVIWFQIVLKTKLITLLQLYTIVIKNVFD